MRTAKTHMSGAAAILLAGGLMMIAGCGDDFGEAVEVAPSQRQTLTAGEEGVRPLHLPQEARFAVVQAQRQSTGDGEADSSADALGTAMCRVSVGSNGTAAAEFQLGHAITYDGPEAVNAEITFLTDYRFQQHAWGEMPRRLASYGLKAYVQDARKRIHGKVLLFAEQDSPAPDNWRATDAPAFIVRLEPKAPYRLVLAGKLEYGEQEESNRAEAELVVKRFEIDIRPAEPGAMPTMEGEQSGDVLDTESLPGSLGGDQP